MTARLKTSTGAEPTSQRCPPDQHSRSRGQQPIPPIGVQPRNSRPHAPVCHRLPKEFPRKKSSWQLVITKRLAPPASKIGLPCVPEQLRRVFTSIILRCGTQRHRPQRLAILAASLALAASDRSCGFDSQSRPAVLLRNVVPISADIPHPQMNFTFQLPICLQQRCRSLDAQALITVMLVLGACLASRAMTDTSRKPPRKYLHPFLLYTRPAEFSLPSILCSLSTN